MSDDFALVRNSSNDFNLSSSRILPRIFPLDYRFVASSIHAVIFIVGVFGNLAVVFVVRRTRILHTPTCYYLVSGRRALIVKTQKGTVSSPFAEESSDLLPKVLV